MTQGSDWAPSFQTLVLLVWSPRRRLFLHLHQTPLPPTPPSPFPPGTRNICNTGRTNVNTRPSWWPNNQRNVVLKRSFHCCKNSCRSTVAHALWKTRDVWLKIVWTCLSAFVRFLASCIISLSSVVRLPERGKSNKLIQRFAEDEKSQRKQKQSNRRTETSNFSHKATAVSRFTKSCGWRLLVLKNYLQKQSNEKTKTEFPPDHKSVGFRMTHIESTVQATHLGEKTGFWQLAAESESERENTMQWAIVREVLSETTKCCLKPYLGLFFKPLLILHRKCTMQDGSSVLKAVLYQFYIFVTKPVQIHTTILWILSFALRKERQIPDKKEWWTRERLSHLSAPTLFSVMAMATTCPVVLLRTGTANIESILQPTWISNSFKFVWRERQYGWSLCLLNKGNALLEYIRIIVRVNSPNHTCERSTWVHGRFVLIMFAKLLFSIWKQKEQRFIQLVGMCLYKARFMASASCQWSTTKEGSFGIKINSVAPCLNEETR